jgi:hypothetical protein
MASKTLLLERFGNLVPPSSAKEVEILSKRTASAMSTLSQLSNASSTTDFIDAKMESISAELALNNKFRGYFDRAKKRKCLSDTEYDDAIRELNLEIDQKERELAALKRQKKAISDDIDEVLPQYSTLEGAYSSILMTKIMSASAKQRKGKPFNQSAYTKEVLLFYGSERRTSSGLIERYCHLTGWHSEKEVKCAHLVPKSLESDELAYLFGVREAVLLEPRNGMFVPPLPQ